MKPAYKPVLLILLVILGMVAVAGVSALTQPKQVIPWRTDWTAAQAEAQKTGKPLFAYFTAEWCGPCQSMKGTTWADADVETALRDFIPVKIDIDQHKDLAEAYAIDAVPTFAVLDEEGRVLKTTSGALRAADFIRWLKG